MWFTPHRTWLLLFLSACMAAASIWIGIRLWPRQLPNIREPQPTVFLPNDQVGISMPTAVLMAQVGDYGTITNTHLYFNWIRTRHTMQSQVLLLCEGFDGAAKRRLFLRVDNDLLTAIPYLSSLKSDGIIPSYELQSWTWKQLAECQKHSLGTEGEFQKPLDILLTDLPDSELIGPMAEFIVFKARTDARVLRRDDPLLPIPTLKQARQLSQDILTVARFYDLPLDYFLSIGALENNYMSVRGDLAHAIWKRQPQHGDVVLKRRRGRVLVKNYSLGVWQITRETLRFAQELYLQDKDERDYTLLPEHLRPRPGGDPDEIEPETLTTFAGLLFRHLLNHFDRNVTKAVGAYNGCIGNPNPAYADSVRKIAHYVRTVITHGVIIARNES